MMNSAKTYFGAATTFLACLCLSIPPVAAKADDDDATRLQPSSTWRMHYADDSCRISRTFGEGDQRVAFYLERYGATNFFTMVAAGKPLKGNKRHDFAYVQFGTHLQQEKRYLTHGSIMDFEPALIFRSMRFLAPNGDNGKPVGGPQKVTPELEKAITSIRIRRVGRDPVILQTGALGKPMEAMRTCTDQLLTQWGIDVEKHRNLVRRPQPLRKPNKWLTADDYPTGAIRRGEQAIVSFRLSVDAQGKPTACHIQQATKPAGFDQMVCEKLMKRAIFKPAITKDGEAIASYWRSTVVFAIPS